MLRLCTVLMHCNAMILKDTLSVFNITVDLWTEYFNFYSKSHRVCILTVWVEVSLSFLMSTTIKKQPLWCILCRLLHKISVYPPDIHCISGKYPLQSVIRVCLILGRNRPYSVAFCINYFEVPRLHKPQPHTHFTVLLAS